MNLNGGIAQQLVDKREQEKKKPEEAKKERNLNVTSSPMASHARLERMAEQNGAELVQQLPIDKITDNPDNVFRPLNDEKFAELKSSIAEQGILNPILVKPYEKDGEIFYRIIAGHNRVRAVKELNKAEIPAIVKQIDYEDEMIILADSNIQREEVTDLEKGWAYRKIYEAIAREGQGKRNDLSQETETEELNDTNGSYGVDELSSLGGNKVKNGYQKIGDHYGIGWKTVYRKIRLTYLIPDLYALYEKGKITQEVAEILSGLNESEQLFCIDAWKKGIRFTPEAAKVVREESKRLAKKREGKSKLGESDFLDNAKIEEIAGKVEAKAAKIAKKRVPKYEIAAKYFPKELTKKKERQQFVDEVFHFYWENHRQEKI